MRLSAVALLTLLALRATAATGVHVASTPAGAKIYLNGYFKGLTPLTVQIKSPPARATAYKVSLLKDGFAKWTGPVTITPDHTATVRATLRPAAPPPSIHGDLTGKIICLDPGHPSENGSGTRGKSITEVRANWLVARKLKACLQGRGAKVVMTKSSEGERVTNRRRADIANAAGAHLMVRLHCDSAGGPGLAIYYPDRRGTVQGVTGPSQSVMTSSRAAAKAMYPAILSSLSGKVKPKGLRTDAATYIGSKQGGALTGSIFSKVPVVCVEMVTLTHTSDDQFMSTEAGQNAMAKALAAGIAAAL